MTPVDVWNLLQCLAQSDVLKVSLSQPTYRPMLKSKCINIG